MILYNKKQEIRVSCSQNGKHLFYQSSQNAYLIITGQIPTCLVGKKMTQPFNFQS